MVRFTVSTTQPKTVFTMFQLQSPFWSFFRETGSLRNNESSGLRGLNTRSMVCRSVLRTLRRFGSCAREMKSSTKMSTYYKGSPVVGSDGSRVRGSGTAVLVAGGGRVLLPRALSPPLPCHPSGGAAAGRRGTAAARSRRQQWSPSLWRTPGDCSPIPWEGPSGRRPLGLTPALWRTPLPTLGRCRGSNQL